MHTLQCISQEYNALQLSLVTELCYIFLKSFFTVILNSVTVIIHTQTQAFASPTSHLFPLRFIFLCSFLVKEYNRHNLRRKQQGAIYTLPGFLWLLPWFFVPCQRQ